MKHHATTQDLRHYRAPKQNNIKQMTSHLFLQTNHPSKCSLNSTQPSIIHLTHKLKPLTNPLQKPPQIHLQISQFLDPPKFTTDTQKTKSFSHFRNTQTPKLTNPNQKLKTWKNPNFWHARYELLLQNYHDSFFDTIFLESAKNIIFLRRLDT